MKVGVSMEEKQLSYYREAVKRMLARAVDRCVIYSFSLDEEIEIDGTS